MTSLVCSTRRMSPIIAASVMVFSACGGAGPADVNDGADDAVAADTIGNDTIANDTLTSDVNGRDANDVVTVDVADDAVAVDVGQDVPNDAALDVPGDATPDDVVVDTGCVPDCTDGPCTDDGCGGDCCDALNVCQTPESGTGLECVAPTEKTCMQIWACAADCGDSVCVEECVNAGSTDGQAQLNALVTCLNDACAGSPTEECAVAAVQEGAECYDEYDACT